VNTPLYSTLFALRDQLFHSGKSLVLAESCTSGMVAAKLGIIPGISEFFCGSMVVYQSQSKMDWLGIDATGLSDPNRGPVSEWASLSLAKGILRATSRASVSAAITGHFGPNAPTHQDGQVFCALTTREGHVRQWSFRLRSPAPILMTDCELRHARQEEATFRFLGWMCEMLPTTDDSEVGLE
jgi:nicotinamide-nucleotide amidase